MRCWTHLIQPQSATCLGQTVFPLAALGRTNGASRGHSTLLVMTIHPFHHDFGTQEVCCLNSLIGQIHASGSRGSLALANQCLMVSSDLPKPSPDPAKMLCPTSPLSVKGQTNNTAGTLTMGGEAFLGQISHFSCQFPNQG